MSYHAYIDQSKRRPYKCGSCGRDITHPVHQPMIPGTVIALPPEPPRYDYWQPTPPTEPDRYGHQPGDPMYGIDDRQASLFQLVRR